ncbi:MAG: hypothetical protein U0R52_11685 [Solirubrobacterales bacterium]
MLAAEITEATRQAEQILRDGSTFQWSTVTLLGLCLYVYAVEVERRRWDIVLAGLAFWLMDWFNELANSTILHATDRSALWTVTGDTSFLILIGLSIEICLLFLITGVVFVKMLPPDPGMRILGIPNRVVMVLGFSVFCVAVEYFLHWTGYFHWTYWFWNTGQPIPIVLLGYATFFAVAAWVFDRGDDRRRQLTVVGGLAAFDLGFAIVLAIAGWL